MSRIRLAVLLIACLGVLALPADASAFGLLSGFGSYGQGVGQMRTPGNLAVAADGSVYVADFGNDRIDVFSPAGNFEQAFGKGVNIAGGDICTVACQSGDNSSAKESAGGMSDPEDIALGAEGNVFVADTANNRIDVFTAAGAFVRAFGSEVEPHGLREDICTAAIGCAAGTPGPEAGAIAAPFGVAFADGNVYVADSLNRRIDVFAASGKFAFAFGKNVNAGVGAHDICTAACEEGDESAAAGAIAEPYSLEVGPDGNLYVADPGNDRIDVFSPEGSFLFAFGEGVGGNGSDVCTVTSGCHPGATGGDGGELAAPTAVAFDASGNVYVAEQLNNRVEEFTATGEFMRAIGQGVVDGQPELEVCTVAAGCRKGGTGPGPGTIDEPYGVAVAAGKIYVSEELNAELARVEVFGEPTTPGPPAGGESTPPPASGPAAPSGPPAGVPPVPPSNHFTFGKVVLDRKRGTATLLVAVPGAGSLSLGGKGIRPATVRVGGATTAKLPIRLTGKAQKTLLKADKASALATVTFTPSGGAAGSQSLRLLLEKSRHRPARRHEVD